MADYYELLKIPSSSDDARIRKAYYKLAKQWHPDKNSDKGAAVKFQEISVAYKTLSDASLRRNYDIQLFLDSSTKLSKKRPESESQKALNTKEVFEYISNLLNRYKGQPNDDLRKKRQREF